MRCTICDVVLPISSTSDLCHECRYSIRDALGAVDPTMEPTDPPVTILERKPDDSS